MPHKRFYFDLETTGTDPKLHSFFQLAALIEIDNKVEETIVLWCKPERTLDPDTLKFHEMTVDDFNADKFMDPVEFYKTLLKALGKYVNKYNKQDKFHCVGYNCHSFDMEFFREFFGLRQDKYFGSWFWHPSLDVMCIAAELLQRERHLLPNFKNLTVAKHLGIEIDETQAHEALYDIGITRKIYIELKKRIAGKE